ncbi:hypothetical protein ACFQPC_09260 [Herminiimonas glaciei]|uniref:ParD-like antitoxin of type II ParDE toxin-antitoxin system n=1 Tax=Herminiimonas glaciei TaxID=523788 RepID=A0ABW2IB12_9BURK
MAIALKLSDELIDLAKPYAIAEHRSVSKQIEYWARLGKAAEDNPELPIRFIKSTLLAIAEADATQFIEYLSV